MKTWPTGPVFRHSYEPDGFVLKRKMAYVIKINTGQIVRLLGVSQREKPQGCIQNLLTIRRCSVPVLRCNEHGNLATISLITQF